MLSVLLVAIVSFALNLCLGFLVKRQNDHQKLSISIINCFLSCLYILRLISSRSPPAFIVFSSLEVAAFTSACINFLLLHIRRPPLTTERQFLVVSCAVFSTLFIILVTAQLATPVRDDLLKANWICAGCSLVVYLLFVSIGWIVARYCTQEKPFWLAMAYASTIALPHLYWTVDMAFSGAVVKEENVLRSFVDSLIVDSTLLLPIVDFDEGKRREAFGMCKRLLKIFRRGEESLEGLSEVEAPTIVTNFTEDQTKNETSISVAHAHFYNLYNGYTGSDDARPSENVGELWQPIGLDACTDESEA